EYPVMINGKMRAKLDLPLSLSVPEIEKSALADATVQKWLEGKAPKKVIIVPGKIVNLVV
ncbi:MAG: leucyl-tRNA synthetase, partial [Cyclobacteriaceae bacterium]|nr:leucyl-tRNA synthetase [Cyclobacteriaceae bacterium]MDX5467432.1 leucyl-tRNA synthetase [Cyclobacteriaceae bacterium]